ncbi:hypothetical protein BCR44DRAFT_1011711 [Catenaria anguillulae PL171]|uniref:Uncharacterized protein n=1 Tax=Catenaria anguillulae PL171 TaxID=765915 RepID=A0A1Y2I6J6_9FUNG|nr:hypothetical protein BCR44DRAFT_1011711 [Catenaria anguillulae PL171]
MSSRLKQSDAPNAMERPQGVPRQHTKLQPLHYTIHNAPCSSTLPLTPVLTHSFPLPPILVAVLTHTSPSLLPAFSSVTATNLTAACAITPPANPATGKLSGKHMATHPSKAGGPHTCCTRTPPSTAHVQSVTSFDMASNVTLERQPPSTRLRNSASAHCWCASRSVHSSNTPDARAVPKC